jgi:hypothetical protein
MDCSRKEKRGVRRVEEGKGGVPILKVEESHFSFVLGELWFDAFNEFQRLFLVGVDKNQRDGNTRLSRFVVLRCIECFLHKQKEKKKKSNERG